MSAEPPRDLTIVRGGHVLTMGPDGDFRDGAVVVSAQSGTIEAVGPYAELAASHPDAPTVGDEHDIVLPGFINGHDHLSEALISGLGETMSLNEWIERLILPVIPLLDHEKARVGTMLKGIEMVRSGITTVNDMFVHRNLGSHATLGVVDGLEAIGLRGVVSFGGDDLPERLPIDKVMGEHEALAERTNGSPLVDFRMGFSTLHTMSDELLDTCVAAARRHGWAIHSHLAEVKEEAAQTRMGFGASNLERAQRSGLLDLDVVFAHCIWVLEPDIHTLREHSSTVVHNPVANMILGSGVCPVPRLRAAGIPVGLGTDGCASNDSHDMLGVIKTAPLLQKLQHLDPSVLTARDSLRMATIEGARALRIDDIVGSLEPGKRADLIRFSGAGTRLAYVHDPYQQIAYCAGTGDIADVWIEGRQVVGDGAVLTVSEPDVVRAARALAYELFTAARLAEHLPSGGHPDIGTLTLSGSD